MTRKSRESKGGSKTSLVECVPLAEHKRHHRSKHQTLTLDVLKRLESLGKSTAVKIKLLGIPAKTLRSAIFRAASRRGIEIESFSDQDHLYISRKPSAPVIRK